MPVGNDVVDLGDPQSQPTRIHPRFDQRVFGDRERRLISGTATDDERHRLRWVLWAVRESAFKFLQQEDPLLPFHPRDYAVEPGRGGTAVVRIGGRRLDARVDVTAERVHAVVTDDSLPVVEIRRIDPEPTPAEASAIVREDACRSIARLLRVDPDEIGVSRATASRAGPGRPVARRMGALLPVDLSLSHHGRWVAHAVSISRAGRPDAAE